MRKKLGIGMISLGAVLILSALLLFVYNQWEDQKAGESAEKMLADVQTAITQQIESSPAQPEKEESAEREETEPEETKISMINGYNYIGVLNLPTLNLELPVLSDCDEALLKVAPCRDFGDLATDDLVIAAHNYRRHFGRLSQLSYGDQVTFTDMDGNVHVYQVAEISMSAPTDVSLVADSAYELVLYTCDFTNQNRIMVGCRKIAE